MEKYTVDIDKVLDEFEENEALKANITIIQPKNEEIPKQAGNFSTRFTNNSEPEKLASISRNISPSDVQQNNNSSQDQYIQDKEILKACDSTALKEKFVSFSQQENSFLDSSSEKDFSVNASINNKNESNHVINSNSKHLNHNIYYKSLDSAALNNCDNSNFGGSSTVKSDLHQKNTYEDEVICVSVQEIPIYSNSSGDFSEEFQELNDNCANHESNSNEYKNVLSYDKVCNLSINSDNYKLTNLPLMVNHQNLRGGNENNYTLSEPPEVSLRTENAKTEQNNELDLGLLKAVDKLSSLSNSIPGAMHNSEYDSAPKPNEFVQSNNVIEKSEKKFNNNSGTNNSEYEYLPVSYNLNQNSLINSVEAEGNVIDSVISNENILELPSPLKLSTGDIFDSESKNTFEKVEESWKEHAAENALGNDIGDICRDDDSGVSSQEDISGNSPSEIPQNHSLKLTSNTDLDYEKRAILNILHNTQISTSESCNKNNLIKSVEDDQKSELTTSTHIENEQFNSANLPTKYSGSLSNEENEYISNSITGARPETDVPENDFEYANENDYNCDDFYDSSINHMSIEQVKLNRELNSNEYITKTNFAAVDQPYDCLEPACQYQIEQNDFNRNELTSLMVDSAHAGKNIDSNTNTEDQSGILQRPTSLNISSLQIRGSEGDLCRPAIVDENVTEDSLLAISNNEQIPSNLSDKPQFQIGFVKPYWIPDGEAPNCMHCTLKFTVIRRRHHCRACGKVLCSRCCNQRARLQYMNKEDRICISCAEILLKGNSQMSGDQSSSVSESPSSGSSPNVPPSPDVPPTIDGKTVWRPHPNNPHDYCSTIPPLRQMELSGQKPPPTVMVPVGVLKKGNKRRKEPKQVIFSDGIRPGGDLSEDRI